MLRPIWQNLWSNCFGLKSKPRSRGSQRRTRPQVQSLEPRLCMSFDLEPNDTLGAALLLMGGQTEGFIGNTAAEAQDVDLYQFDLNAGDLATFNGYGYGGRSFSNGSQLRLFDDAGEDVSNRLSYWGT